MPEASDRIVGGPQNPTRRAKLSEILIDFAGPLISLDPAGPPNIETLRSIMRLAEACWNLPVLQKEGTLTYARAKRSFDDALGSMPSIAATALKRMMNDRRHRFAALPFLVAVTVKGESLDDARVVVEARQ